MQTQSAVMERPQVRKVAKAEKTYSENELGLRRKVHFQVRVACGCGYESHYFSRVVDMNSQMVDGMVVPFTELRGDDVALTRAEYVAGVGQD